MTALPSQGSAWRRLCAAFPLIGDESGSAMVEAGFVLPPFFMILVGIFEVCLVLLIGSVIDGSARDASRLVRTGQIQSSTNPTTAFQTQVCNSVMSLVTCSNIVFDVRTFSSYGSVSLPLTQDANGKMTNTTFNPGSGSQIVAVRVSYRYNFFTPLIGKLLSDNGTNSRLLLSTVIFTNEPF